MFYLYEIISASKGRVIQKGGEIFEGISIDSRTIRDGELFIALEGERYDGHDFIDEAISKGAGAITQKSPTESKQNKTVIVVKDTLKVLHAIARDRCIKRGIPVIAITGSNGKTSTKEMTAAILSKRYSVFKTPGNLNNHIGLPLSLCMLDREDMAVVEMGARAKGDIKELCEISNPEYGVVTNIAPAHLEGFGSLESVRAAKMELMDYIEELFVNADDTFLYEGVKDLNETYEKKKEVITFGIEKNADFRAFNVGADSSERGMSFGVVSSDSGSLAVTLSIGGVFNAYNALAAIAVGRRMGIENDDIVNALREYKGLPMRLEIIEWEGATIISDIYNANPASMKEALKELIRIKKNRGIALLGDMLELGSYSIAAHKELGKWIATLPVDIFIAIGPLMKIAMEEFLAYSDKNKGQLVYHAVDSINAREIFREIVVEGDTVLMKASRSMRLENVLEGL